MTVKVSHYKKYTKHRDKDKEKIKEKQTYKYIRKTHKNTHKNTHRKTTKTNLIVGGFKLPRVKSYKQKSHKARTYHSGNEEVGQSQGQSHQSSSSGEKEKKKRSYWYHVKKAFGKFAPPELRKRYREYKFKNALSKVSKVKQAKTGNDTNNLTQPLIPPVIPNDEAEELIAGTLDGPKKNNYNNEGYGEGPEKPKDGGTEPDTGTGTGIGTQTQSTSGPVKPKPGTGIGTETQASASGPVKPTPSTGTGTGTGTQTSLPSGPVRPSLGTETGSTFPKEKYSYGTLKNSTTPPFQGSASAQASAQAAASAQGGPSTSYTSYILRQNFYPGSSRQSSKSRTKTNGTRTNFRTRNYFDQRRAIKSGAYNPEAAGKSGQYNTARVGTNDYNTSRLFSNNPEYDVARESSNDYATALSKTNPNRSEINIIRQRKNLNKVHKELLRPKKNFTTSNGIYLNILHKNNGDYMELKASKKPQIPQNSVEYTEIVNYRKKTNQEIEQDKRRRLYHKEEPEYAVAKESNNVYQVAKYPNPQYNTITFLPQNEIRLNNRMLQPAEQVRELETPQTVELLKIDPVQKPNNTNQRAEEATISSITTHIAIPQKKGPPVANKPSSVKVAAALAAAARPKPILPRIIVTNTSNTYLKEAQMGALEGLAPFNASKISRVKKKAEAFNKRHKNVTSNKRNYKIKGNSGSGREYNPITRSIETKTQIRNITNTATN